MRQGSINLVTELLVSAFVFAKRIDEGGTLSLLSSVLFARRRVRARPPVYTLSVITRQSRAPGGLLLALAPHPVSSTRRARHNPGRAIPSWPDQSNTPHSAAAACEGQFFFTTTRHPGYLVLMDRSGARESKIRMKKTGE